MADPSEIPELHQRAVEHLSSLVAQVGDDQWANPTPCDDWTVRDLLNHVTGENAWTAPLFAGQTIAEVGDRFDGDLLGSEPVAAWNRYAAEAVDAIHGEGAMDRVVHLSFGDFRGHEYAMQLFADMVVHSWDLARATGADETLDADLVSTLAAWFTDVADLYRQAGAVAARPEVPADADDQTRLLAEFGRRA